MDGETGNQQLVQMDTSNPLFLHPNENPTLLLVDTLLDEKNYHDWSRSMRMGLSMKNKLGFIDGTIPRPAADDRLRARWTQCDITVMTWLMRAMTTKVRGTVKYANTAQEMWLDLKKRYSQLDAFRLSDLLEEVSKVVQGNESVTDYFGRLKAVWDEIMILRPIPPCECDVKCTCRLIPTVTSYVDTEYVIRFTKGLNEKYAPVKSYILLMKPLPGIDEAFAMSLQLERQMEYAMSHPQGGLSMVMAAMKGNISNSGWQDHRTSSGSNNKLQCTFCGKAGHSVDKCVGP